MARDNRYGTVIAEGDSPLEVSDAAVARWKRQLAADSAAAVHRDHAVMVAVRWGYEDRNTRGLLRVVRCDADGDPRLSQFDYALAAVTRSGERRAATKSVRDELVAVAETFHAALAVGLTASRTTDVGHVRYVSIGVRPPSSTARWTDDQVFRLRRADGCGVDHSLTFRVRAA